MAQQPAKRTVVKKVTNAVLYSDNCIRIDNVILSYPHLDKPFGREGGPAKYGFVALAPKETHQAVKELCVEVINKLLTENKAGKIGSDRKFIRDGDDTGKEENEGMWVVSAREDNRPTCRDENGEKLTELEVREKFYGGCKVHVLIRPWFQNHKEHGKRVNAGAVSVVFVEDGEPFGEGRVSDDDIWGNENETGGSGLDDNNDDDL
jgi:hypothetical protein